jgi:hypothetical protein
MIMHEAGGFYADLDMECLQPLIQLPQRHSCLLSEENYEHINLIHHRRSSIINNCVMGCRAGHPFYKDLVDRMAAQRATNDVIQGMGSLFFTSVYEEFQRKENISLSDHIALLPPRYLLPVSDQRTLLSSKPCDSKVIQNIIKHNVNNISVSVRNADRVYNPSMNKVQFVREAEICQVIDKLKRAAMPPLHAESLATRHWVHMRDDKQVWDMTTAVHIKTLIPPVLSYVNILAGKDKSRYYKTESLHMDRNI